MRFVHSRGVIHCNLTPDNILVDWDWNVRIADFGSSTSSPGKNNLYRSSDNPRYLAPECYDNGFRHTSDVFAFALIAFEVLTGRSAFPENLNGYQIALMVLVEGKRPEIPDYVPPPVRLLLTDCWADDPDERPTFAAIVDRLIEMKFKLTAKVNSAKLVKFVERIQEWEMLNN
jgi:serine/threonine protein kinase